MAGSMMDYYNEHSAKDHPKDTLSNKGGDGDGRMLECEVCETYYEGDSFNFFPLADIDLLLDLTEEFLADMDAVGNICSEACLRERQGWPPRKEP